MGSTCRLAATVATVLVLTAATAEARWTGHFSSSEFVAESAADHPTTLSSVVWIVDKMAESLVCFAYLRTTEGQPDKGKVVTRLTIERANGDVEQARIRKKVAEAFATACLEDVSLGAGDVVFFDHRMKLMPRLDQNDRMVIDSFATRSLPAAQELRRALLRRARD